jgi:hypothetical protein
MFFRQHLQQFADDTYSYRARPFRRLKSIGYTARFIVTPLLFLLIVLSGCSSSTGASSANTPTPATTPSHAPAPTKAATSPAAYNGWNSIAVAFLTNANEWIVTNSNYQNGYTQPLTQYGIYKPTFDGFASSGQDLLYQTSSSGQTMYYTVFSPRPRTGFFYELNDASAGNAIWMPDSRHVLILSHNNGVFEVDVQTGQAQKVLSLPVQQTDMLNLEFYRAGYLYFRGTNLCLGSLCRVRINSSDLTLHQLSSRQMNPTFFISPDDTMIYYRNTGPVGEPGLYAVRSDGTQSQLLRQDGAPVGFAADNSLVYMREVNGKFQVVKLGATLAQDQVIFANAAPGAVSLCTRGEAPPDPSLAICSDQVAFAPYGHAIEVQATFADGTNKVWNTNLITGKQFILQVGHGAGTPVTLLGWDRVSVVDRRL